MKDFRDIQSSYDDSNTAATCSLNKGGILSLSKTQFVSGLSECEMLTNCDFDIGLYSMNGCVDSSPTL